MKEYLKLNINKIVITGDLLYEPQYSHTVLGEHFYKLTITVSRNSGTLDCLPVIISGKILRVKNIKANSTYCINGQLRSYNRMINNKSCLILILFAQDIFSVRECKSLDQYFTNKVVIDGYICKPTNYRVTPLNRRICDILLATNGLNRKSNYLPCICWGNNAKYADYLQIGDHISIEGRFQSRRYEKKLEDGNIVEKTAYEVSISRLLKVEQEDFKFIS